MRMCRWWLVRIELLVVVCVVWNGTEHVLLQTTLTRYRLSRAAKSDLVLGV